MRLGWSTLTKILDDVPLEEYLDCLWLDVEVTFIVEIFREVRRSVEQVIAVVPASCQSVCAKTQFCGQTRVPE